mgnify:CR=1 FL=1
MILSGARAVVGTEPRTSASPVHWQIVTGEHSPQPGGVSDYTRLVARALALAGDRVDVWAPPCVAGSPERDSGVLRAPAAGSLRSSLVARAGSGARCPSRTAPIARSIRPARLWLESGQSAILLVAAFETRRCGVGHVPRGRVSDRFGYSTRENALGAVTRWMAAIVGRAAERIFVSIPAWQPILESLIGQRVPIEWLPVPSTIAPVEDPVGIAHLEESYRRRLSARRTPRNLRPAHRAYAGVCTARPARSHELPHSSARPSRRLVERIVDSDAPMLC